MKSPRFLAALAMAAVLTTGVSTTAHASGLGAGPQAPTVSTDFKIDAGSAGSGQQSTQTAIKDNVDPKQVTPATGEISVNGTFNKVITNLPTPDKEGHYLRVTMPISMDYVYNLDTNHMQTANALIQNQSVKVVGQTPGPQTVTDQPIKMTFVGIHERKNTNANANANKFEFVSRIDSSKTNVIQLPFTLKINGAATAVGNYDLADIRDKNTNVIKPIEIQGGTNIDLTLDLINGLKVTNGNLIDQATTLTTHGLELKFEYMGQ